MFATLWEKDALERSMSKSLSREHDGFDHIRSNMDNALDIISATAKGISKASDVAMDIQDAHESVNRATSRQQRTQSEAGICLGSRQSSDKRPRLGNISQTTPVGHSNLGRSQSGIGSAGTQVVGNNTAPPIRLTLGKQLNSFNHSVENFLSLMKGTGSVSVSFGGRLRSAQDERVRSYNCYRHNLHANSALIEGATYPSGSYVMFPTGSVSVDLVGGNTASPLISSSAIRDIDDGSVYWSSFNKADLEDMSFNLNKFKLGPTSTTTATATIGVVSGVSPDIQILDDTKRMQNNLHRAFSAIWQNNRRLAKMPISNANYSAAPYMYDAVFKQGTVDYLFMNKGESPLELEVVVYRIKKSGTQGVSTDFNSFDIKTQLEMPICQGMINKTLGGFANQSQQDGYTPLISDWINAPSRPYLPKNRFMDQSQTPFTEVNRVKLTIQSGQRRPFQIKLGGVEYDPTKLVLSKRYGSASDAAKDQPLLDEHSYIVCLALNGIAMSRQLSGATSRTATDNLVTVGPIIGDCFAPADLQWYSQYTEDIGAMAYKKVRNRNLFTYGAAKPFQDALSTFNDAQTTDKTKISSTPVALLTQAQAVRIPQTPTQVLFGTSTTAQSTSGTSTTDSNKATGGATTTP
jgi:hypothetical protein